MRNGMVLEGIVEEWVSSQVVLKSIGGQSLIFIHHPDQDILLTKVVLEEPEEISKETKVVEEAEHKERVKEKLHEVLQPSGDPDLDKSNIKQLRELVVQQEKKIIKEKRREHFGSAYAPGKMGKYSTPKSAYMPSKPCKNNAD
jgi:hypothetical protein